MEQNQKIYNRQPGEKQSDYDKFIIYLNLDPLERSVKKVLEVWNRNNLSGKTDDIIALSRTAGRFLWSKRSKAYDMASIEEKRQLDKTQHFKSITQLREEKEQLAQVLLIGANEILEKAIARFDQIETTQIEPKDIPSLLKIGVTLADLGLNTKADSLGIMELIKALILDKPLRER